MPPEARESHGHDPVGDGASRVERWADPARLCPEDLGIGRLFGGVRDAVIVAEASSGRIVLWNPAASEIFGYAPSEALGMSIDTLVPERLKARHRAGMSRFRDTGRGEYVDSNRLLDLPAVHKNGEEIQIEMSLTPVEPSEPTGGRFALAIVRNVTGRKRVEEALRESEERYRLVAMATGEAIWDSDLAADKQVWDGAVEAMLGYPVRQVTDTAWWEERVHPEDRERVLSGIGAVLQGGGESWIDEYRFRRADGGYCTVVDRAYVVHDGDGGAPVRLVGSMVDVTARREAEKELERRATQLKASNAELGRFAYSVAHDLRAPLRAISGFSELLLMDHADGLDPEGMDYLRRVRDAGHRMEWLIDALLELSDITRHAMRREMVHLSGLAERFAAELENGHPDRGVEFVVQRGLVAEGDPWLLDLALKNLLRNAFKFTGKQPQARIEFGATPQNGVPAYFVRDDGVGFDMAHADKLFGVFQRLHSTDEFEGIGAGLAKVERIVHRHGGRVWAEGESGNGATFYFTL